MKARRAELGSFVIVMLLCATAWAHKPSDAHLRLDVHGDRITGRLDISVRDLAGALPIDDGDGQITWGELQAAAPRIATYVQQRLAIAGDGAPCPLELGTAKLVDLSGGPYWALPVSASCTKQPQDLTVTYQLLFDLDAQHRGLIRLDGQTVIVRDGNPVQIHLGAGTSIPSFVRLGIWHIWMGIDHVLFLLCLVIPAVASKSRRLHSGPSVWKRDSLREAGREVFEIVTAFTLAHSITLVISAVGLLRFPSRYVETAIALSVVAAALNNVVRAVDARWAVAFALGLLHGFGFSSVLIDLGLPSHELIGALLGFNAGVELGQGAIVIALLPLLYVMRRTLAYQVVLWGGSSTVALIATLWSYQRWVA